MNEFGTLGLHALDTLLTAYPCGPSSYVLQAGAHLGINTLIASSAGCHAFAIEGFRQHSHYSATSAAINGVSHLYHPIHALVGAQSKASVSFSGFDLSDNNGELVNVPMVTIDGIIREALQDPATNFPFVIIDVEGFEADAMLGATELLSSRRVMFWNIEVWLMKGGVRRDSFPFVTALERAGYTSMRWGKAVTHADLVFLASSTTETDNLIIDLLSVASSVPRDVVEAVIASCNEPA